MGIENFGTQISKVIRRFGRWFLLDCLLARIVRHRILETTVPPVIGLYYGTLDIWGDDWSLIRDHRTWHEWIYGFLVFSAVLILFFRGLGDWIAAKVFDASYPGVLESLLVSVGKVITAKTNRFQSRMKTIRSNRNVFDTITHPIDQINVILAEAKGFFDSTLPTLAAGAFDITVMCSSQDGTWKYLGKAQQNWNHTDPTKLAKSPKSTIRECADTGEPRFHADKAIAAANGRYLISKRDKHHGKNGSIYCFPIIVQEELEDSALPGQKNTCVVTFTTYGAPLCDPDDTDAVGAIRFLCGEFVQRIRVEFMLYVIKQRQKALRKKQPRRK